MSSDPTQNTECAVAYTSGAYRCHFQGRYIGFVGVNPTDKWKIAAFLAFDSFIPHQTTVVSSSTPKPNFEPQNSLTLTPHGGKLFDSSNIVAPGGPSTGTNYLWTELQPP